MWKFWPLVALLAVGLLALVLLNPSNNKRGEVVELPSGLKYEDLKVGNGDEAKTGDTVEVHYTGRLAETGKEFDSSYRRGMPLEVKLGEGGVIKGWDEGIPGMRVGGKRKLMIPAELGYREKGSPPDIPPNADLVFEVELLRVR
jgi:FKBP-type peptidyl-prolyl cis-trans isomerase